MSGHGVIEFSEFSGPRNEGNILIVVSQPAENPDSANRLPVIRMIGSATCNRGKLVAHFGADAGHNEVFKVVGGSMAGELDPPPGYAPFGVWSMQLVHLESLEVYDVSGAWGMDDEDDAAKNNGTPKE